jgi:hypothetical protein
MPRRLVERLGTTLMLNMSVGAREEECGTAGVRPLDEIRGRTIGVAALDDPPVACGPVQPVRRNSDPVAYRSLHRRFLSPVV